jgi:hypothetical protein
VPPFDAERTCESREVQRSFEEDLGAAALPLLEVILHFEKTLDLEAGVIGSGWSLDIHALPYEVRRRFSRRVWSLMEPAQFESRNKSFLEASAAFQCLSFVLIQWAFVEDRFVLVEGRFVQDRTVHRREARTCARLRDEKFPSSLRLPLATRRACLSRDVERDERSAPDHPSATIEEVRNRSRRLVRSNLRINHLLLPQ